MFFLWQSLLAAAKAEFVQLDVLIWHRMAVLSSICHNVVQKFHAIVFVSVL